MLKEFAKSKKGKMDKMPKQMNKSIDDILRDINKKNLNDASGKNIENLNISQAAEKPSSVSRCYKDISSELRTTKDMSSYSINARPKSQKHSTINSSARKQNAIKSILNRENIDFNDEGIKTRSSSKNYSSKNCNINITIVQSLEQMIYEIKTQGFDKLKNIIDNKLSTKKQLEIKVEALRKQLNFLNSQKRHIGTQNTKKEEEINFYYHLTNRWEREIYYMNKEIPFFKQEIPEMKNEIEIRKSETNQIKMMIKAEDKNAELIKDEIRRFTKKISDTEKDKESMRSGISLLKKHIEVLRGKIKNEDSKSRDFLSNVSQVLNKSVY